MAKKLEGAGLRGQVAGQTSLSTVGKEGHGLTYRGYAIEDLADKAKFEEVAYLLLYGHLPNKTELDGYQQKLISNRKLPEELKKTLELIPAFFSSSFLNRGVIPNSVMLARIGTETVSDKVL